ncbi:MAG: TonB-dependent receptor [Caulobacteraceae bacterium]|nr:TonB-dependent receptor [Caulobacteraceae bacterium]
MSHLKTASRGGAGLALRAALLVSAAMAPAVAMAQAAATRAAAAPDASLVPDTSEIVVTGVRGGERRTVANSPIPIDVISAKDIAATGKSDLKEILNILIPSFDLPGVNGGGTSWTVRAFTLRGLTGDEALILVNGKRRHNTALINNLARVGNGGVPVDLDLIPTASIDHIEVLRDGASAQYGSDAIAGVINIILKNGAHGGTSDTVRGQNYGRDGAQFHEALDYGTGLPNGGFAHFSLDLKYANAANRSVPSTYATPYGAGDPRNATANRRSWGYTYGPGAEQIVSGAYNLEAPLNNGINFYSFTTLSHRLSRKVTGTFLPNASDSLQEIYPNGFNAQRRIRELDFQSTVGAKGETSDWHWDASSTYGRDFTKLDGENTLNASLGPTSQTYFHLANQIYDQWTNNLDVSRDFQVGLATPLTVSFGLEHRYERYEIQAGEPNSYKIGSYLIPAGSPNNSLSVAVAPLPGLASYNGTSPAEAGARDRNNLAAYVDLDTKLTQKWFVGVAGRYEHYTDSAGDTFSGKVTTRYEVLPGYAFRATVSNGFKAPSLAQEIYASNTISGTVSGGTLITYPLKVFPVDSAIARTLGATALTPENSINYSVGFTAEPVSNLRLTVDAYQINIRNRILETGSLFLTPTMLSSSPVLSSLLSQFPTGLGAQYYTNAASTRTRGVDVVGEYSKSLGAYGSIRLSAALTLTETRITKLKSTPAALAALGFVLFDAERQADLTVATPRDKITLSGAWNLDKWSVNLQTTRYGRYTEANTTGQALLANSNPRYYSPKWITNLEIDYNVLRDTKVGIGANNLFDVYPDSHGIIDAKTGAGRYGNFSPFGITGGYWYARLTQRF